MNEASNFYDNANTIGSRLSNIQQRETEGMESRLELAQGGWSGRIGMDRAKEAQEEGEGGAETAGGMATSLTFAGIKKLVSGRIKSGLKKMVQKKIDEIKAKKASNAGDNADDNLSADDPAKAPASMDAPVRSQPDIDIDNLKTPADFKGASANLKARVNNMDSATKQKIQDNFDNDPDKVDLPSSAEDYQNNIGSMESHVIDAENDPATKFTNEDTPDIAPDVPPTVTSTTVTGTNPANIRPTQASTDNQLGGDTGGSGASGATGGQQTVVRNVSADNAGSNAGSGADNTLSEMGNNISQKGMDSISDKLGVDFGELTPADIGGELTSTVGDVGGDLLGSLGGALGSAMEFLGPIGMLIGLGTTIFGLNKDVKEEADEKASQVSLSNLAGNINDLGGMSMGSIASTPLDTAQFRSGGASLNF